jgi:hypothetical protein
VRDTLVFGFCVAVPCLGAGFVSGVIAAETSRQTPAWRELKPTVSDLLRLAVADCKKVERRKTVWFDMSEWVAGNAKSCLVCMSGAVMLCEFPEETRAALDRVSRAHPAYFKGERNKFDAINCMRAGCIRDAANWLELSLTATQLSAANKAHSLIDCSYGSDLQRAPWPTYLKAADILAKAGL